MLRFIDFEFFTFLLNLKLRLTGWGRRFLRALDFRPRRVFLGRRWCFRVGIFGFLFWLKLCHLILGAFVRWTEWPFCHLLECLAALRPPQLQLALNFATLTNQQSISYLPKSLEPCLNLRYPAICSQTNQLAPNPDYTLKTCLFGVYLLDFHFPFLIIFL